MKTITKKEFKQRYNNKEFKLVHSFHNASKELALTRLKEYSVDTLKDNLKELSRYSIDNQGESMKTLAFESDLFIILETIIDNSKDRYTSRDDKQMHTVVYLKN